MNSKSAKQAVISAKRNRAEKDSGRLELSTSEASQVEAASDSAGGWDNSLTSCQNKRRRLMWGIGSTLEVFSPSNKHDMKYKEY